MPAATPKQKRIKLSRISAVHYFKLVYRSCLFLVATILYIINRSKGTGTLFGGIENNSVILGVIWLLFVVEMVFRFFPSSLESMGCQKQFAHNNKPTGRPREWPQSWQRTFAVAAVWLLLNGIFGALYYAHVIDEGVLLLISLGFSVCDMICILFFCPFQTWLMRNKCCVSCRIYNWDYAMMFTPLVFIKGAYTWSILLCAIALLLRWEIAFRLHPERFSEATNASLSCANCTEKLCHHKKQLRHFLQANRKRLHLLGNTLIGGERGNMEK